MEPRKSRLFVLSVKSKIMLDVRRKSIVHKIMSCGPHLSVSPSSNANL